MAVQESRLTTIADEIEMFGSITEEMREVFTKKRSDYGQTSEETYKKFGPVSLLVRMYDKLGRLDNLLVKNNTAQVSDESVSDTLLDLANYAIIAIIELAKARRRDCCDKPQETIHSR